MRNDCVKSPAVGAAIIPLQQAGEGQDREGPGEEGQREEESLSRGYCGSC